MNIKKNKIIINILFAREYIFIIALDLHVLADWLFLLLANIYNAEHSSCFLNCPW